MRSNLSISFPLAMVRAPANHTLILFLFSLSFFGCSQKEALKEAQPTTEAPVFKKVSSAHSGVTFKNIVDENIDNYFDFFAYVYNGGGVGIGDINNDGLSDIYFTASVGTQTGEVKSWARGLYYF